MNCFLIAGALFIMQDGEAIAVNNHDWRVNRSYDRLVGSPNMNPGPRSGASIPIRTRLGGQGVRRVLEECERIAIEDEK